MTNRSAGAAELVELWRGDYLESVHRGHAVVMGPDGDILAAWGDADATIFPRSSCKMIQALPLLESGAAAAHDLTSEHLALACASHNGARIHTDRVARWLADLALGEADLRCGPQMPQDRPARSEMQAAGGHPCQLHNNCSGKHAGFLTLGKYLDAGPEYIEVDHPVQHAVFEAFAEMTGEEIVGHGVDGCSAPNPVCSLTGLARAAQRMAAPQGLGPQRSAAARDLVAAMARHPDLVAGEGRACTALMRGARGGTVVKTGAEGVFVGILPAAGIGVALKVEDGTTRAAECAMAALLVRLGVAEAEAPLIRDWLSPIQLNRRNVVTGLLKPSAQFYHDGALLV
ncbi:MAG: asparaginase [Pseudomonadota bacterium]